MAMTRFRVALREIASVERNIFHPFVGDLLINEDGTLATRGGMLGLRLYDDLERDAKVYSALQKRKLALAAYPWRVVPGTGPWARKAAKLVEAQLRAMNFVETVTNLMDAVLKGFAVVEVMWAVDGAQLRPAKAIARDQRRFRFDIHYQLHLLTYGNMLVGEDLPPRKFIGHSFGAKDGSPYGLGLGTRLFWLVFFKRQDIGFWLAYLDKFGMPTAVGKYPPDASQALKDKLIEALDAIAQDTGIAIPEGMVIELLEAQGRTANDGYEKLARYMDEQIAETVQGETLTSNIGDAGSKAAAGVHNDVRLELTQADAELMTATLNGSLVQWIVDLNLPGAAYPRLIWEIQQPEDLSARADRDTRIVSWGFKPTLKYVTETYGGEWVEAAPPAPAPAPGATGAAAAADPGAPPGDDDPDSPAAPDDPDDEDAGADADAFGEPIINDPSPTPGLFAERLGATAQPAVEAMARRIRALIEKAGSLEEVRDRLIDLYPELDAASFAEAMQQAVTASHLAGRYEVKK